MNILQTLSHRKLLNTRNLFPKYPPGGRGYLQRTCPASVMTIHRLGGLQTESRSLEEPLRCEEPEDIFCVFSAEICPHPHMANRGAGKRWRQLLRKAMTSATVRVEFTLTNIRLICTGSFRRRFSSSTGRLRCR